MRKTLTKLQLAQRRKIIVQQTKEYYLSRSKAEVNEDLEWGRIAAQQIIKIWDN